jgi:uncharacterized membrane protein
MDDKSLTEAAWQNWFLKGIRLADSSGFIVALFALYSLISSLSIAWNLPPFMGPDEEAHLLRANAVAHGYLVCKRVRIGDRVEAGAEGEPNLPAAEKPFDNLRFHFNVRVIQEDYTKALHLRWDRPLENEGCATSAIYPPFFYLPQVLALRLGKATRQHIIATMYMARVANALACTLIGSLAILLAGRVRLFFFTVLLLPMTVSLYAISTQDGMLIVTMALAGALIARTLTAGRPMTVRELWIAATCLALAGMAKPPCLPLALILIVPQTERPRLRFLAVGICLAVAVTWHVCMSLFVMTPLRDANTTGVDPSAQLHFLLSNPFAGFRIAYATLHENFMGYCRSFVGVLGSLDTYMTPAYYHMAYVVLGIALAYTYDTCRVNGRPFVVGITLALLVASAILTFVGLYLIWTPVGFRSTEGVQGRYFLPLAVMLPIIFTGGPRARRENKAEYCIQSIALLMILCFPCISILAVERALILRYYLR